MPPPPDSPLRLRSTRQVAGDSEALPLAEAVTRGLPADGGLYLPEEWPILPPPPDEVAPSPADTAAWAAPLLLGRESAAGLSGSEGAGAGLPWATIARQALDFPIPLRPLGSQFELLELFHGPTLSFKDVGARFLARALARVGGGPWTILTATSGDTGGAVAHAVAEQEHLRAMILFPRGRVSDVQRRQFTTLGSRVLAVAVDGVFDDCQTLARRAVGDPAAQGRYGLLSANSINPARLLPQVFYYLHLARLRGWAGVGPNRPSAVVVPSGNLGNLTAGVLAARAGAPLAPLVGACNQNDALVKFVRDGRTRSVAVRPTLSSAMDVGAPSNLERLEVLFGGDVDALARGVPAFRVEPDEATRAMRWAWDRHGVLLDPHTAVGVAVARRNAPSVGAAGATVLATAHPAKFPEAVRQATGETPPLPAGQPGPGVSEEITPLKGGFNGLLGLLKEWAG